jgi:hypothetical protein
VVFIAFYLSRQCLVKEAKKQQQQQKEQQQQQQQKTKI